MFKAFVALVLSLVLVTSLFGEVKVGETLSGEKAKEALKTAQKELKGNLKLPQKSARNVKAVGGMYPFDTFSIDYNKEGLLSINDSSGNPIVFVAYTLNQIVNLGNNLFVDNSALFDDTSYYVQEWDKKTNEYVGRNVNAYEYYNGGHNFNAAYTEWGMPHSNSFGMWIKISEYPNKNLTLFSRNENYVAGGGYRSDYFHFQLLPSGQLEVNTKITDYSVDSLVTSKSIPLNKWVYIQAIENVLDYQIKWETKDGVDSEEVSDTFVRDTLNIQDSEFFTQSKQKNRLFDTDTIRDYANNNKNTIQVKEIFYNPIVGMFELKDNYSAKEKLIFSVLYKNVDDEGNPEIYSISTLALEAYNLLASGSSSVVDMNDFDIYYDVNTLNIIMIDFRNTRQGAWE